MKHYNDYQNYLLNCLAYENISLGDVKPPAKLVDVIENTEFVKKLRDAGLDNLVITDYANNNNSGSCSGFCAVAFKDPQTGDVGMTFRGTENLDDLLEANQVDMADNIQTALLGASMQADEALAFFERNKSPNGKNFLYGHSKGGELASEVFVEYYDEIVQMHILNPQPINPYLLNAKQKAALKSEKVDVVIIDGDIVTSLGEWPFDESNTRYVVCNDSQEGLFGPHLIESASFIGNNYAIEENPYARYPEQKKFCDFANRLISNAQKGNLIKISLLVSIIVQVYMHVVRDIPASIISFNEAVIVIAGILYHTKDKTEQLVIAIKEFIQITVGSIRNWARENIDKGDKEATSNPQIKIDTHKLRDYAQRIQNVNRRIGNLDRRLDSLYRRVGLLGLWNLMQADCLTGYSWRLLRCASYLNDTASDFEAVEKELAYQL